MVLFGTFFVETPSHPYRSCLRIILLFSRKQLTITPFSVILYMHG